MKLSYFEGVYVYKLYTPELIFSEFNGGEKKEIKMKKK